MIYNSKSILNNFSLQNEKLLSNNFLLTVLVQSYNHEKYIDKCLNSISTQKVDFKFNCIIADDCSNDNTIKIVSKYVRKFPNLFTLIERNINLGKYTHTGRLNFLHSTTLVKSKYLSIIEADDYWVDPLKLQKQVDILESNNTLSLCATRYYNEYSSNERVLEFNDIYQNKKYVDINFSNFLEPYIIHTSTVTFRRKFLTDEYYRNPGADLVIWAHLLSKGNGVSLSDITSVYTRHSIGQFNGADNFRRLSLDFEDSIHLLKSWPNIIWIQKRYESYKKEYHYKSEQNFDIYSSKISYLLTDLHENKHKHINDFVHLKNLFNTQLLLLFYKNLHIFFFSFQNISFFFKRPFLNNFQIFSLLIYLSPVILISKLFNFYSNKKVKLFNAFKSSR